MLKLECQQIRLNTLGQLDLTTLASFNQVHFHSIQAEKWIADLLCLSVPIQTDLNIEHFADVLLVTQFTSTAAKIILPTVKKFLRAHTLYFNQQLTSQNYITTIDLHHWAIALNSEQNLMIGFTIIPILLSVLFRVSLVYEVEELLNQKDKENLITKAF